MSSIYLTYHQAIALIRRDFWPLLTVTLLFQFPALLISEVHAQMSLHQGVYVPASLFELLLYLIAEVAVLSLLARNRAEATSFEAIRRGVVAYTKPIIRVELNQLGLIFVLVGPVAFLSSRFHYHGILDVAATSLAILFSSSKLSVGSAAAVREHLTGKEAVSRSWSLTSGRNFWYVAGCLVVFSIVGFLGYRIAEVLGPLRMDVVLSRGLLGAALDTTQTVVIWCIYSHLVEPKIGD